MLDLAGQTNESEISILWLVEGKLDGKVSREWKKEGGEDKYFVWLEGN